MMRMSVICGAMALAMVLGSGSARAEEKKNEVKAPTAIGQMRIGITKDADGDKELTRGWYGHHHSYHHSYYHRSYYHSYHHYRPYYYYTYTPVYYYPPTYYYYYCNGGTIGSNGKDVEPRTSAERAEIKMTVPSALFNGSK